MPSKDEKQRRRALMRQKQQVAQAQAEKQMPLSKAILRELFDRVNAELEDKGCDHTLTATRTFLVTHQLPEAPVVTWLQRYGGYCDCEVIANVEEEWGPIVGSI